MAAASPPDPKKTSWVLGYDKHEYPRLHAEEFPWPEQTVEKADDLAAKQRTSHVTMGHERVVWESSAKASFIHPGPPPKRVAKKGAARSNVQLSFEKPSASDYTSDSARNFGWKDVSGARGDRDSSQVIADRIRSTHFSFGSDVGTWETTVAAGARGARVDSEQLLADRADAAERAKRLTEVHIEFGREAPSYTTTNALPDLTGAERVLPNKVDTYSTSFSLGSEAPSFVSTAMAAEGRSEKRGTKTAPIPSRSGAWKKLVSGEMKIRERKW